jgi:uncharacterized Zn finger protein (UPF0148 family)
MDYTVKKGFKGKHKVAFNCPRCNFALESPLEEAGGRFPCPTCQRELTVPGVQELEKLRAEEAAQAELRLREAAQKASQAKALEEHRAWEAQQTRNELARKRAEDEDAKARARESQKTAGDSGKRAGVSATTFTVTLFFVVVATVGLIYFSMVRPLQRKLSDLANTVNHNADGLAALTKTVNHNAEAANRVTAALAADLVETDRLARNANRHAHEHSRF